MTGVTDDEVAAAVEAIGDAVAEQLAEQRCEFMGRMSMAFLRYALRHADDPDRALIGLQLSAIAADEAARSCD